MYNNTMGQLVCNSCNRHNGNSILINKNASATMKFLINTHIDKIKIESNDALNFENIKKFLYSYISFHVVDSKKMKSYKLLTS
mgnify:CR=1 FL=1